MRIPDPPQDGKFRVLVIEDDQAISRLVFQCLTESGFDCSCASDGRSGLELFSSYDPHLILLDLMMPGMDGEQACRKIRERSAVPVIVTTARDAEDAQLRVLKMGADDYIIKPFSLKPLVARIVAHLRRVYRYDAAEMATKAPESGATSGKAAPPPGWASCQACGYIGPQQRFRNLTRRDLPHVLCPNCQRAEHVVFALT